MIYAVGLLSIVFLALAIMVIVRVQKILKGVNGEESDDYAVNVNANAIACLVFLILGTIGAVWSFMSSRAYFLPEAASKHGKVTDELFWFSMGLLTIACVIVNVLIFYFAWKYRYVKGKQATFYPDNIKLEVIWTVIPMIVMAALVFTGYRAWTDIMSDAPQDAQVIEIMGKQFGWQVRYPGVSDNKLGAFNFKLINDTEGNVFGIDLSDEASFDDFTNSSEMHVQVGKPVLLKIRARDVLHSVFIPHMRVKMDAVPGMPTKFWFIPEKTTDQARADLGKPNFDYEIACTEVCGQGHFGMRLRLIVEDEYSFKKWMAEQKPFLTEHPELISKVPDNLKAKAAKYIPAVEAPADSTVAQVQTVGIGTASIK